MTIIVLAKSGPSGRTMLMSLFFTKVPKQLRFGLPLLMVNNFFVHVYMLPIINQKDSSCGQILITSTLSMLLTEFLG